MPTYIVLMRYTSQGIGSIKDSPRRLEEVKQAVKAAGGEFKAYYLTLGRFDEVAIVDVPDEVTGTRLLLSVAAQGNVQTETLRAFTEDEYRSIIAHLP